MRLSDPPLTIRTNQTTGTLAVAGELDMCTAPHLRTAVSRAQAICTPVEVDLKEVTFADCSALRAILDLLANDVVRLASLSQPVRRLASLTGTTSALGL